MIVLVGYFHYLCVCVFVYIYICCHLMLGWANFYINFHSIARSYSLTLPSYKWKEFFLCVQFSLAQNEMKAWKKNCFMLQLIGAFDSRRFAMLFTISYWKCNRHVHFLSCWTLCVPKTFHRHLLLSSFFIPSQM
jgi:hypothetical protein